MSRIHPTAVVDAAAKLASSVVIGPYCVVGPHVTIGDDTELMAHAVVDGHTRIGCRTRIFPFACIGMQTQDLKYAGDITYAEIGDDTTLREYVTVNTGTKPGEITRVGSGSLLMAYTHVAHGCRVGNGVIISNGTQLAGEVEVQDQAILSGLVAIHQFVRVGVMAMVGGCSKIQQDCPPFMLTDGNPAAVRGLNVVGLQRRGISAETRADLKKAFRLLHREGLSTPAALERVRQEIGEGPEIRQLMAFYEESERGVTH